jgi:cell division protein FtsI (penicillin-binding protein 3)
LKEQEHNNNDKRLSRGLMVLYLVLTVGVGLAITLAIFNIQVVHGDEWRALGERREAGLRSDPARRGNIYSSDGKILATTVTECDLYLDLYNAIELDERGNTKYDKQGRPVETGPVTDSSFNRYLDTLCVMLADAMPGREASYYRERIAVERCKERPRRCFLVQRDVPYSVWLQITRLPGWSRGVVRQVDGESVVHQVRAHIYGNMAGNTIGFRNRKESGSYTGLEGYYDSILRGQDGLLNCRRLTKGIWLPDEPRAKKAVAQRTDTSAIDTIVLQRRVDGRSIVSTIDTRYQDIAEASLRKALNMYGGTAGCAMLMEMSTGYMLACVNLAVDTAAHEYMELRDRNIAVSDVYEPGSTFKTVILSAMLDDPDVKIDTTMRLPARYKNFGGKYGEIKDDHG